MEIDLGALHSAMGRRSPPPGLHHRATPLSQLGASATTSVPVSPAKAFLPPSRLARRTLRLSDRVRFVVLRFFVPLGAIVGLLSYLLAISLKDWPPAGQTLSANGLINQFQGEWWVSPNVTRAERFLLVVAHR